MCVRAGDERDAAVVGHVQPLVSIGRPRVGELGPGNECTEAGGRRRPQAECTVDMEPGLPLVRKRRRSRRSDRRNRCSPHRAGRRRSSVPSSSASTARRALRSMRPRPSARTSTIDAVPIPRSRSARSIVACRLAPATTRIGGAPGSPSRSTSQPTLARTSFRAAARQVACAIWQPVTSANDAVAGIPSKSFSHSPTISSTTAADGPQA